MICDIRVNEQTYQQVFIQGDCTEVINDYKYIKVQ